MALTRFRTLITARVLLQRGTKTLFLAQTKANGDGYSLPGGKVEGVEFVKEGLVREVQEEIGITLNPKSLELALVMHKKIQSSIEILFLFKIPDWEGEPKVLELDKFRDIIWVEAGERPRPINSALEAALKAFTKGKNFTQFPKKKKDKSTVAPLSSEEVVNTEGVKKSKAKKKEKIGKKQKLKEIYSPEMQPTLENSMEDVFVFNSRNLDSNIDNPNGEL